jgi:putative PIN family toxin of toxin-antitoxin system
MPKNKATRIVIDTNLWISFLISRHIQKIDHLLFDNRINVLFSIELLEEIKATVGKPKLRRYFAEDAIEELLFSMENYIELVLVSSQTDICRDKKDNFLLSLCKDGNADYLLTGDNDLLDLKTFGKTKIVAISDFLLQLK